MSKEVNPIPPTRFELKIKFREGMELILPQPENWAVMQDGEKWVRFKYMAFGDMFDIIVATLQNPYYSRHFSWKSDKSLPEFPSIWIPSNAIDSITFTNMWREDRAAMLR